MNGEDPRDKVSLTHEDVVALNFIRARGDFIYRRHFRAGLRSHIMQVLLREDVEKEEVGLLAHGIRHFPKARPLKMLRIFRTRFRNLQAAEEELDRFKIIENALAPFHMARSNEFLADFLIRGQRAPILCGLQEYVEGETLNPWNHLDDEGLRVVRDRMPVGKGLPSGEEWISMVKRQAEHFLLSLRDLISKAGYVPDLAGSGNLLLTPSGMIKLVDINNISRVSLDPSIPLDDRGYPVCDKSIEALFMIEKNLLGRSLDPDDDIYRVFLHPDRMQKVRKLEMKFHGPTTFGPDSEREASQ